MISDLNLIEKKIQREKENWNNNKRMKVNQENES